MLALLLGLLLMLLGRGMRHRRGLGGGKTVSLERVTLTSRRLGLTGRPDRLIKTDGGGLEGCRRLGVGLCFWFFC